MCLDITLNKQRAHSYACKISWNQIGASYHVWVYMARCYCHPVLHCPAVQARGRYQAALDPVRLAIAGCAISVTRSSPQYRPIAAGRALTSGTMLPTPAATGPGEGALHVLTEGSLERYINEALCDKTWQLNRIPGLHLNGGSFHNFCRLISLLRSSWDATTLPVPWGGEKEIKPS